MEETVITRLSNEHFVQDAAQKILAQLQTTHFFAAPSVFLLSGGSSIAVAQSLLTILPPDISLSTVSFALADERFVPVDSDDSNAVQLAKAGVIELIQSKGGRFIPILLSASNSAQTTTETANATYEEMLKAAEQIAMLAGIGADGHTTGILPQKNQKDFQFFSTDSYLVEYEIPAESTNPHKHRITTTLATLSFVDTVFLYATGEEKKPALTSFIQKSKPMHELPALALYLSQQPVQVLTTVAI